MKKLFVLTGLALLVMGFTAAWQGRKDPEPVPIPASVQRSGNAKAGWTYLTTGDYLKSGIPLAYFQLGFAKSAVNYLNRDSVNSNIPYDYTAVKAPNGQIVVAPNCMQCHAQLFEGKLVMGLGNSFADFSRGQKLDPSRAESVERFMKKTDPVKYEAARHFLEAVRGVGGDLYSDVRGVNVADRLAELLVSHRDPTTLRWSDRASWAVNKTVVPTDVPAWWMLKKKHGMFYNGFGRGDFGRFLMASNLLTVNDTSEAREVDGHFNDVLAYLNTLQPPEYTHPLNRTLVKEGGILFVQNCSKCHGSYGRDGEYPNLLIPEETIGTDSMLYRSNYQSPMMVDWFNQSWFAQGDHPAKLEPFNGYIAPPLNGVWITAPYFHNGSVPDLESLLDSKKRPSRWARNFEKPEYDYDRVGWKYSVIPADSTGTTVYNTAVPGYGNYGHTFGDRLTDKQRKALIEYLKTL